MCDDCIFIGIITRVVGGAICPREIWMLMCCIVIVKIKFRYH